MLHRRTWADVDLSALDRNLAKIRAQAGPGVDVMLVIKADAYGHGAVPVAWHLTRSQVAYLGVGDSRRPCSCRAAGITTPILILGAVVAGELEDVIRGRIAITVHSGDRVRTLNRVVRANGADVPVHVKVDTGLGRLGCRPERVMGIVREIRRSPGLTLEGIATHLTTSRPGTPARRRWSRSGGSRRCSPTWRRRASIPGGGTPTGRERCCPGSRVRST